MATTVLRNSVVAGVMNGLTTSRFNGSVSPASYAQIANVADAIASEFITINAGSGAPLADADNANVGPLAAGVAAGTIAAMGPNSTTATDYVAIANQIYAATKQALTKLL